MLRLVTYYTPTHAEMCHRFVLSRAAGFDDVRRTAFGQTCPTGEFKAAGWNECMLDKLRCLMALPTDGMPTIYVDADVCLFPGLADWVDDFAARLGDDEIAFSDDVIQWCAGVMVFRSTPRVQTFWQTIADLSVAWDVPDQEAIHALRAQAAERRGRLPIRPRVLSPEVVCNWGTVSAPTKPPPWNGEPFAVPTTCLAWHANWTIGIKNKLRMLERVATAATSEPASQTA